MPPVFKKLQVFIKSNPMVAYPVAGLAGLAVWSMLILFVQNDDKPQRFVEAEKTNAPVIGLSVGGVDQQVYNARIEKDYYEFQDRIKSMEEQIKNMKAITQDLQKFHKETFKSIARLDEGLDSRIEERISDFQDAAGGGHGTSAPIAELAIAHLKPVLARQDDFIYLPAGSFCKGTLITGVYASADVNNPLPVLIVLDDAFHGPNKTRVPLKNAFVLGKAFGDLVSARALIQVTAISTVLPDSRTFEKQDHLGYVTDEFGELGVHGNIVRNTGKQLAMAFMGGFMAGGTQAIADKEVSTNQSVYGTTSKEVTGNSAKNAVFSGLARSASRMSEYYEKQAENLVPAVHIKSGTPVYFIVQKGVSIDGLLRNDRFHAVDIK